MDFNGQALRDEWGPKGMLVRRATDAAVGRTEMIKRLTALTIALLICASATAQQRPGGNSILVIEPYRHAGTWVFDDEQVGLRKEPFISGVPEILDKMVADIPGAEKGFRLLFAAQDFPGSTHKFLLRRPDKGGHWYYSPKYKMEGWLCPSLLKYFRHAPRILYGKAEPLKREPKKTK
jgi:hypothetical protein